MKINFAEALRRVACFEWPLRFVLINAIKLSLGCWNNNKNFIAQTECNLKCCHYLLLFMTLVQRVETHLHVRLGKKLYHFFWTNCLVSQITLFKKYSSEKQTTNRNKKYWQSFDIKHQCHKNEINAQWPLAVIKAQLKSINLKSLFCLG